jgi:hypothetical protein
MVIIIPNTPHSISSKALLKNCFMLECEETITLTMDLRRRKLSLPKSHA